MQEEIRPIAEGEQEELERFLERAYGHGRGFFSRNFPRLWPPSPDCSLVLTREGEIKAHVGAYPLELAVGPARVSAGAIGAVAADPKARGRGYMSRLMEYSLAELKNRGVPLAVLWGNRQRYGHFGFETCGQKYNLLFDRRSLAKAGARPAEVLEVDPEEPTIISELAKLHGHLEYRVVRENWPGILQRPGVRVFMGAEGYLLSWKETKGDLVLAEVVSPEGQEADLILGAMDWAYADAATLEQFSAVTDAQRRLVGAASSWSVVPEGMFRILNLQKLCQALSPYFAQRAEGLPPFEFAIGARWQREVEVVTVFWDGEQFTVAEGRLTEDYHELAATELAGAVFGGPFSREELGFFGRVLPVPVHLPNVDHV